MKQWFSTWLPHLTFQNSIFQSNFHYNSRSCIHQFNSVQCVHKVAVWFVETVHDVSGGKVSICEVVVSVIVRQTLCKDMSNCDWLLRWNGWNVQTDSLYGHVQLWLAAEMERLEYRQTVCMDMSNCNLLLRWSGWNVQTDSLYGHVQL